MRALTLHQPWAWAVAHGYKPIENRSWPPNASLPFGDTFAIHAGRGWDDAAMPILIEHMPRLYPEVTIPRRDEFVHGAIIATARLITVVTTFADAEFAAGLGQGVWFFGPFGWVLDKIQLTPPVPIRGWQGLWIVPEATKAAILWAQS